MPLILLVCLLVGMVLAIKSYLVVQALILGGAICYTHFQRDYGLAAIPVLLATIALGFGMAVGDIYYFMNFYHGTPIDFGWLLRP